jgi:rhamnosyltransferase
MAKVSIIVRTRNEERWIGHCLEMVFCQNYRDFEVILVDNQSEDHTVAVASRYDLSQIVHIERFKPGLAINEGIRASVGEYLVCLSAHCIPTDEDWLGTLLNNMQDKQLAGVYGRQLPVTFTDDVDKRDLLMVFGQDRRIQRKDYFFHNANSLFRRSVWQQFPFDEKVTNIEDRVWGKAVIEAGYQLAYEPEAAVYHHHGLHQGNTPERARGVVSIIEQVDAQVMNSLPSSLHPENANIVAVLPILQPVLAETLEAKLLERCISELKAASYVNTIYVLHADEELAQRYQVEWLPRDEEEAPAVPLETALQKALAHIEAEENYPEALLYVNYEYPFRPHGLFDQLITDAQFKGCDSVFAGYTDYGHIWHQDQQLEFSEVDPGLQTRQNRQPFYRALYGLGCVSSAAIIRTGQLVGGKTGIVPVSDLSCTLRLREAGSREVIHALLEYSAC